MIEQKCSQAAVATVSGGRRRRNKPCCWPTSREYRFRTKSVVSI